MEDIQKQKHRVAVYSPFYYPELISTGKANTMLGNEICHQGWQVDVICSHPLYPKWQPERTEATLPNTRFFRGGGWLHYPKKAVLRRAMLELWFAFHATLTTLRISSSIDVALAVYPPSLFAVVVNALLPRRVKKVALVHDLQGVYSQQGYNSGFSLLTRVIHAVEKRCFQSSDKCIFFSKDIAHVAQQSFDLEDSRIFIQYPFITINTEVPLTNALEDVLPDGKQHIVYSGALGEKQNPELLAEFMAKAAESLPSAEFHIFSGGPKFELIRERFSGKSRLQFHDLIPEEQLAELYARSTVQLLPQAPGTESGSLPSKLPNLLFCGVHVMAICSVTSEVSLLLAETKASTLVPEWQYELFLKGIQEALNAAQAEDKSARQQKASPLFPLFQVSNLAKLVIE